MNDASAANAPLDLTLNPDWKPAVPAHGVFDAEACGRILALGAEMRVGTLGPEGQSRDYRNSRIGWLVRNDENLWLFDRLNEKRRMAIRTAIIEKGVVLPFETRHKGWVKSRNNWGQVCHGGLTAGALAVLEQRPDLAARRGSGR